MRKKVYLLALMLLLPYFMWPVYAGGDGDGTKIGNFHKRGSLSLGVSSGFVIGTGFSAMYFLSDKLALQVSGYGPRKNVYDHYECCSYDMILDDELIGGTVYFYPKTDKGMFIYLGGRYHSKKVLHRNYDYYSGYGYEYENTVLKISFNSGVGVGYSIYLADFVTLNLMAGYASYFKNSQLDMLFFTVDASLMFSVKSKK